MKSEEYKKFREQFIKKTFDLCNNSLKFKKILK